MDIYSTVYNIYICIHMSNVYIYNYRILIFQPVKDSEITCLKMAMELGLSKNRRFQDDSMLFQDAYLFPRMWISMASPLSKSRRATVL